LALAFLNFGLLTVVIIWRGFAANAKGKMFIMAACLETITHSFGNTQVQFKDKTLTGTAVDELMQVLTAPNKHEVYDYM
jgi:hypothetical protein